MNSLEFDTKELRESLSQSISDYLKSLETIFADTESIKVKDEQIAAEYLKIFQEVLILLQDNSSELRLESLETLLKKIENELRSFLKKYSDFLSEEEREKIESHYLQYRLIKGFGIIANRGGRDIFDVLEKKYQGLDIVARAIEDRGKLLSLNLIYDLPQWLKEISEIIIDCIRINTEKNELLDNKEFLEEIDRYRRLIDRTINSTLWYLDKYKQEIEEENRKKEQLEKEEKSLERLKAWVEEDQLKDLTQEELEEEDVLMKIIDENRERKLFS